MTFFTRPTSPALDEILGQKFPVLDHGFVRVVDYMGNDGAIVQAARVSYGGGTKTPQEDANLIRYLMRHRHCYAAYMQVLTVQGWKRWDECGPTETFLVPDPATRTYQRETCALETFDVDEKLVTYSNSRMSFAVTPDHRMWFKGKYQSRFSIHHASTMPRWGHFDPLVGYHCPETKNATSSPWFKLLGFYLGDGCHESPSRISFHLRKERKKKFLRSIIEALELETIERMSSTYDDADVIYIKVPPGFFDYVIPNVRSAEKALMPEVIDTLDGPAIRGLWEGLVNSDGHIAEDRYQITYSSTSPELIKLFSALGAMLGYDVHNVFGDDRATAYSINTRTTLEARKGYFDEQTYKGKVYCATTSTGLLAVRGGEDKFGFVCGNTSPFEMCVDGDTRVQTFPCPGAAVKHYTMRELAAAFEAGSAGSWARLTYIRTVNPNTGMVERTRIKRVWKTGVKPCFRVTVGALSRQIIVTDNHPFLCPDGEYRTLADLSVGSEVALNGRPATPTDIREHVISMRSAGKKLDEISRALGIAPSTVCKLARQAGLRVRAERKTGFLKKDIGDHADPRSIARRRVPHGPCMLCGATGRDIHHIDENPHNNDASNLLRLCAKHHRHIHTYGVLKKAVPGAITAIEPVGEREVFDLEVASDNHNFVADGFVVHNCEIKLHVKLPIFVARQWIRHRTACLAADTLLSFDLPARLTRGNRKHYTLTVKEIYDRWQPTINQRSDKQKNPLFKRQRVQQMQLRSINEETNELYATHITNIVQSGVKKVLTVEFSDGSILRATADHKCLTSEGWLPLQEALNKRVRFVGLAKARVPKLERFETFSSEELASEEWRKVSSFPDWYEVSNLGRVRSWTSTRNKTLATPTIKKPTLVEGYPVVSLSVDGKSRVRYTHRLVLEAFVGPRNGDSKQCRHLDGRRNNSRLSNLAWGTAQENANDRMEQLGHQRLASAWVTPKYWKEDGEEPVYDIAVSGPYHNFIAGGVVVHNSVNEVSGRYSVLPEEYYVPERANILPQSKENKQGREEDSDSELCPDCVRQYMEEDATAAFDRYNSYLADGLARELARINLPLSTYTEWYWKIDLHNLFHFLKLRMDSHAQWEIRQYAEEIFKLVKLWVPVAAQAWLDYQYNSVTLSAAQIKLIAAKLAGEPSEPSTFKLSIREVQELEEALKRDE